MIGQRAFHGFSRPSPNARARCTGATCTPLSNTRVVRENYRSSRSYNSTSCQGPRRVGWPKNVSSISPSEWRGISQKDTDSEIKLPRHQFRYRRNGWFSRWNHLSRSFRGRDYRHGGLSGQNQRVWIRTLWSNDYCNPNTFRYL